MKWFLAGKIHKAAVTEANLEYVGSITIDKDLIAKTDMQAGEKVLVVSNTTGARLETYVIEAESGSGIICMNGAAAHLIKKGEEIIIMSFQLSSKPLKAKCILVDKGNRFVKYINST